MSAVGKRIAAIADLFAILEDERRHEIIDGALLEKGAATGEHGGAGHLARESLRPSAVGVPFGDEPPED